MANTDLRTRTDRILTYFEDILDEFAFVELSDAYLSRANLEDVLMDVPVPLRPEDMQAFKSGEGLRPGAIGENMAVVIGCDPKFKYAENYAQYIRRTFSKNIAEGILKEGIEAAEKEDYLNACAHFRASLYLEPEYCDAMFSLAKVCQQIYENSQDRELIGRFKAESLEWFELLTEVHPDFPGSYYYLGYAYVNLGLYAKGNAAWELYLEKTASDAAEADADPSLVQMRAEIWERKLQIKEPVNIEQGCNEIARGLTQAGVDRLVAYADGQYAKWWPLHYYLGLGYEDLGQADQAIDSFKRVLALNGSHLESMQELVTIYNKLGDAENAEKYETKMLIVQGQLTEEADTAAKEGHSW